MSKKDKVINFLKVHEGKSFEATLESFNPDTFFLISYIQNAKLKIGETKIIVSDPKERYYFHIPFHGIENVIDESDDRRKAYNVFYENGYNILVQIDNEY